MPYTEKLNVANIPDLNDVNYAAYTVMYEIKVLQPLVQYLMFRAKLTGGTVGTVLNMRCKQDWDLVGVTAVDELLNLWEADTAAPATVLAMGGQVNEELIFCVGFSAQGDGDKQSASVLPPRVIFELQEDYTAGSLVIDLYKVSW